MTESCTYCGCDVSDHDPVFVAELIDGERTQTGKFCNYGCLVAHVEAESLAEGATCRVDV